MPSASERGVTTPLHCNAVMRSSLLEDVGVPQMITACQPQRVKRASSRSFINCTCNNMSSAPTGLRRSQPTLAPTQMRRPRAAGACGCSRR